MKPMLLFSILLLACGPVFSCPVFREPAVDFSGITNATELVKYKRALQEETFAQHRELMDCQSAEFSRQSDRGRGSEQLALNRKEAERWRAEQKVFWSQLNAAGEAHLALLAAQPFKGAYSGQGSASTGGATYSQESANRSNKRYENTAPAGGTTKSASNPGSSGSVYPGSGPGASNSETRSPAGSYAAWRCVHVGTNKHGTQQLINQCAFNVEMYWRDNKGGWNQAAVDKGKAYIGGMKAVFAVACNEGDLFNKKTGMCH